MGKYTDLLYARPSFVSGLGRVLDVGGTLNEYNTSSSPDEADQSAMLSDWYAVGDDIREAILTFGKKSQSKDQDGGRS